MIKLLQQHKQPSKLNNTIMRKKILTICAILLETTIKTK